MKQTRNHKGCFFLRKKHDKKELGMGLGGGGGKNICFPVGRIWYIRQEKNGVGVRQTDSLL